MSSAKSVYRDLIFSTINFHACGLVRDFKESQFAYSVSVAKL